MSEEPLQRIPSPMHLSSTLQLPAHLRELPQLPPFGLGSALQLASPPHLALSDADPTGDYNPSSSPWDLAQRLQGLGAQDAGQTAGTTSFPEIKLREDAAEGDASAVDESEGLDSSTAAAKAAPFGADRKQGGLNADVGSGSGMNVSATTSQLQRHGDEADASQSAQRLLEEVETTVKLLIEVCR